MARALKVGLLAVGALVVVTLLTLRVSGLEPAYVDPGSEQFAKSGRTTRPGAWLTGEVVHEPVTNWDWVNKVNDPIRKNTIMLENYGGPACERACPHGALTRMNMNDLDTFADWLKR